MVRPTEIDAPDPTVATCVSIFVFQTGQIAIHTKTIAAQSSDYVFAQDFNLVTQTVH